MFKTFVSLLSGHASY